MSALRNEHSNVIIEKDKIVGKDSKCHWDVYKNTKRRGLEQKHGDIGVLVQLIFEKTKILEGVAFLEAKRIYHDARDDSKSKFEALDRAQLERYCKNSSFHRTVFYDFSTTGGRYSAKSWTLPTRHLLTIDKNDRNIYPYCEYLSYCLTNRYFQGYELDFDPELVESVKGFLGDSGGIKFLVVAQSVLNPELSVEPELVKINREIYAPLDDQTPNSSPQDTFDGPGM